MRNTINSAELEKIIKLAQNKIKWEKVYGDKTLAYVLKCKTGKNLHEIQTMKKLPPRQLQSIGSRVPKGYKFNHIDASGRKVFVEE